MEVIAGKKGFLPDVASNTCRVGLRVSGLGFRGEGLGFKVEGLGFRGEGLEIGV